MTFNEQREKENLINSPNANLSSKAQGFVNRNGFRQNLKG